MEGSGVLRTMPTALGLALFFIAAGPSGAADIQNAAWPSLVIGADGFGLVAYQNRSTLDLEVAHCVDAVCSAVTISIVDSAGNVGARAAMVLGPGGLPLISYLDITNRDLKLAFCADAVCASATTVVVDSDLGIDSAGATAIAIGGDGRPLIAYAAGEAIQPPDFNRWLRVAHCENAGCTSATFSNVTVTQGDSVDLEIAGDGRGVITSTVGIGSLDYWVYLYHCDNLACTSVTPAPHVEGDHTSLEVGPDGLPIYSYLHTAEVPITFELRIRRCLDHTCTTFTDQAIPTSVGQTSLALTSAGLPRVAALIPLSIFGLPNHEELRLYECSDASCTAHQGACLAPWGAQASLAPGWQRSAARRLRARRPRGDHPTVGLLRSDLHHRRRARVRERAAGAGEHPVRGAAGPASDHAGHGRVRDRRRDRARQDRTTSPRAAC